MRIVPVKLEYLKNASTFFDAVCVEIYRVLSRSTCAKNKQIYERSSKESDSLPTCIFAYVYNLRDTCRSKNQDTKVLKSGTDRWTIVVLSSKARALNSLITSRTSNHIIENISRTYEISLNSLLRKNRILSVSVCRVCVVVYTTKVSRL